MISISIPVEPHVKRFLSKRYGAEHIATKVSFLGAQVLQALKKEYERPHLPPEKKAVYSAEYKVLIPERYSNTNGHTVSLNNLLHLADAMDRFFTEAMFDHIDMQVQLGGKAMEVLRQFLAFYHISEDDVKLESLYKAYQRHCQMRIKSKKIAV
jgi:hypothetical protein